MKIAATLYLLISTIFLFQSKLNAQEIKDLVHITQQPLFDGLPDEPFWKSLEIPNVQHQPFFKGKPRGESHFYIGYDDTYIWLAGRLEYENEGDIRAISKKRDSFDGGNDYFGICLDTFNDNENALAFFTTPAGLRWDGAIFNDAQGDLPINVSWNTFWDVKTHIEGKVWTVEMRVPFTSMKFQDNNGEVEMGITVWWWSTFMGQTMVYPEIDRLWGGWSAFKPSQFQKVKLKNIFSKKPIFLAPYGITGHQRNHDFNEGNFNYDLTKKNILDFGLDAKFSLSAGFTMDLTVNTDFSQVEADNQQVNLTRFNLFFPEKRLFFQERSSVFGINTGKFNRLFYSRRIGLDQDANIVPIIGGARLIGRAGKWDVGFLDMQTAKTDGQLSTNYGVLRTRRQMGSTNSYLGGMLTNQIDTDGNYDLTGAIDGIFDLGKNKYLTVVGSTTKDTLVGSSMLERSKIYGFLENRSLTGVQYGATYAYIGNAFDPAMGFELRNNNHQYKLTGGYGWKGREDNRFQLHRVFADSEIFKNLEDGKNDSEKHGITWYFETNNAASFNINFSNYHEFIREEFDLYGSTVLPGKYNYYGGEITAISKSAGKYYVESYAYLGSFFDGVNYTLNLDQYLKPSSLISSRFGYQIVNLDFPGVERDNTVHFLSNTTEISPSTKITFALLTQYNSTDKQVFTNFRFRYNPKEGNDLYLVVNDLENSQRNRFMPEMPILPNYENRTIVIKYIYTFVF